MDLATYIAFTKEVITYICDQVAAEEDSKTLASLAQVSRAFHDPALDALWRRIPGVTPLLRLLPPDLWEVKRQPMLHTRRCLYVLTFLRPIRPDDLHRLRIFAKRVKVVQAKQSHNTKIGALIHPVAWAELGNAIDGPLLPNLVSLRHNETRTTPPFDDGAWPSDFLVGPKLEYAAVSMCARLTELEAAARLFSSLSSGAPDVKHIDISILPRAKLTLPMSLGVEIEGLRNLTVFTAPSLELLPEAVEHLASLPNLRNITIMTRPVRSDISHTAFPFSGERTGRFPALVNVRIYTNCLVWCAALVRTISSRILQELLIENRFWPSKAPILEALLAAVGQLPCTATLHILTVFSGEDNACRHPGPTLVSAAAMLPLAALTALTCVRITGWCEVLLDDAVLGTLARAWPALQSLDLHFPRSHPGLIPPLSVSQPLVTLQGISVFARACPLLERLHLTFDARVVPELDPTPRDGRFRERPVEIPSCAPALRILNVGESPIGDHVKVASYLSLFFPMVETFYDDVPGGSLWKKCGDMLIMFHRVREQERKMRQRRLGAAAAST
ncbi:hypothetical protein VTO73DRAFT_14480 [Trametes versicolor]